MQLLVLILLSYILLIWVLLRLVVPHLGVIKTPIPTTLPPNLARVIAALDAQATSDQHFLELAYSYVTTTYTGSRLKTVTQFWKAFQNPLLAQPGFLPCTAQNYLLRTMLVTSGRFVESDIEVRVMPFNFFIHQYLRITVGQRVLDVDPWAHFLGVPLGKRLAFIH